MGSRILSRSFTVEKWGEDERIQGEGEENEGSTGANNSVDSAMDVDDGIDEQDGGDDEEEGDEGDDPSDIAMVPMADMLNARYGSENVCPFSSFPSSCANNMTGQVIPRRTRPKDGYHETGYRWRADCMLAVTLYTGIYLSHLVTTTVQHIR